MKLIPYLPNTMPASPEDGVLAAFMLDTDILSANPGLDAFVRPQIKGEYAMLKLCSDPTQRKEWLDLLISSNATLVTRTQGGTKRSMVRVNLQDWQRETWLIAAQGQYLETGMQKEVA